MTDHLGKSKIVESWMHHCTDTLKIVYAPDYFRFTTIHHTTAHWSDSTQKVVSYRNIFNLVKLCIHGHHGRFLAGKDAIHWRSAAAATVFYFSKSSQGDQALSALPPVAALTGNRVLNAAKPGHSADPVSAVT